jgi:pyruvate dehydrogenase E2 component (dihydrolipoamide acetyltransferase)
MATKVHMEALSPTMEEGQIVKWLKAEGEAVKSGEILAEVETDKATMELVARGDGILRKILSGEGVTTPVGDVIAVIAGADEDISALVGAEVPAPREPAASSAEPAEKGPDDGAPVAESVPDEAAPAGSGDADGGTGRVKASPLARRLAEEAGISLGAMEGSGPGGRIVKRDVEAAMEGKGGEAAAVTEAAVPTPPRAAAPVEGSDYEDIPLTQIRKTIARRLVESIGPVPHFFLTIDVDMSRAVETRKQVNALLEGSGDKVSFNDIVLKATAVALRAHPECNVHWLGDSIRRHNRVHLSVAVAIEDGLITPVIRDADRKGFAEIGREVKELAARARDKKLKPEEYTGGTFSVSNLGMFGIEEFTAVINPPEGGILAVGALEDRPVVVDGQVVVRPRMKITMSCDHRVIDGAQGSRFLATLKQLLEEPVRMLV